jgi:hypothetical protein
MVMGAKIDRKKGEISFYKDKKLIGVAFTIDKKSKIKYHALIDNHCNGAVYKFTKPKFK